MKKLLVYSVVLAAIVGFWLNEPIPHNFSRPWRLRLRFAMMKTGNRLVGALAKLGLVSMGDCITMLRNILRPPLDPELLQTVDIQEREFSGVKVLVYSPKRTGGATNVKAKGLFHIHGGAWIAGNAWDNGALLLKLASQEEVVIVSVDYRLAPKYPFPTPFEDCLAACKHFVEKAEDFGVDPARIGISGFSAGANLAAAVVLKLRDTRFPVQLRLQVLVYPELQFLDLRLPSAVQYANGPVITVGALAASWSLYLTGGTELARPLLNDSHTTTAVKGQIRETYLNHNHIPMEYLYSPYNGPSVDHGDEDVWNRIKEAAFNPYLAPLLAKDLSGLPRTYILGVRCDCVRDDGILYAWRLRQAGVDVTDDILPRGFHGMMDLPYGVYQEVDEALDLYIKYIKDNL